MSAALKEVESEQLDLRRDAAPASLCHRRESPELGEGRSP
jgi:hypothetical protein